VLTADGVLGWRIRCPEVRRRLPASLPVNGVTEVVLVVSNASSATLRMGISDELPPRCELVGRAFPIELELSRQAEAEVGYALRPQRRGELAFGRVVTLLRSPLGFWERRCRCGRADTVRVYPDFALVAGYLDLLAQQQSVQLGIHRAQRRGEGLEFLQLREYRPGDSLRQIDWKATARRRSLISREYQDERDQHVVLLVDSGRRMRASDGALSHFDHALNALLLLAYVALKQGDTVAVRVFGHEQRWLPARRGVAAINTLLHATYDLQTGTEAADYLSAAEDVLSRQHKRALVVLVTNLREEDADLEPALELLRRRHLVLIANLREHVLDEISGSLPADFDHALRVVGTYAHLATRQAHHRRLAGLGNVLIDCVPDALPIELVNAYWRVKGSGLL